MFNHYWRGRSLPTNDLSILLLCYGLLFQHVRERERERERERCVFAHLSLLLLPVAVPHTHVQYILLFFKPESTPHSTMRSKRYPKIRDFFIISLGRGMRGMCMAEEYLDFFMNSFIT